MSVLVQRVVGQLELQEGDGLLHPVAAAGRRIGVDVRPAGRLRLRLPRHLPLLLVPLQGRREQGKKDKWMRAGNKEKNKTEEERVGEEWRTEREKERRKKEGGREGRKDMRREVRKERRKD